MSSGERRFPAEARSAAEARGFVRSLLVGCDVRLTDAIVLLTSELVTNAVVHGDTAVIVDLARIDERFRVTVSDESSELPELRHPDLSDPHGRGLSIVDELSDEWGVEQGSRGKTVWFTIGPASAGIGDDGSA
jgi:anti-sigma regulatory factor (Ser/Thr protein kinase)